MLILTNMYQVATVQGIINGFSCFFLQIKQMKKPSESGRSYSTSAAVITVKDLKCFVFVLFKKGFLRIARGKYLKYPMNIHFVVRVVLI